jgi:NTP pyrophosphatase (non-canonical NTP hydrolase)
MVAMNLAHFAAEIARNVGREFPDPLPPRSEMVLRQLSSLVEECIELDQAIEDGDLAHIAPELCDASITPYLVAHYAHIDLDAVMLGVTAEVFDQPYREAGKAMKAGRRFLGIARRTGTKEELAVALARVSISVQFVAQFQGINLEQAIADKLNVIFSRGWREVTCYGCGQSIDDDHYFHHVRLDVNLHHNPDCQVSVRGEDVRGHCMERVTRGVPADVSHSRL